MEDATQYKGFKLRDVPDMGNYIHIGIFWKVGIQATSIHAPNCGNIPRGLKLPRVHAFEAKSSLAYFNGGDEHGILRPVPGSTRLPALGQLLWLVPGHCDPTVNLHDAMVGVSGGLRHGLVEEIFPVDARGVMS